MEFVGTFKDNFPSSDASFVTAAYFSVRLIPQDLRALHLDLFSLPSDFDFLQ